MDAEKRWHCRVSFTKHIGIDGKEEAQKSCALIFGTREIMDGREIIKGDTFHVLKGPTAEASIRAFAEQANLDGMKPEHSTKCFTERNARKNESPDLFQPAEIQCIKEA